LQAHSLTQNKVGTSKTDDEDDDAEDDAFEALIAGDELDELDVSCLEDNGDCEIEAPQGEPCYYLATSEGKQKFSRTKCYAGIKETCKVIGGHRRKACVSRVACAFGRAISLTCNLCPGWVAQCDGIGMRPIGQNLLNAGLNYIYDETHWNAASSAALSLRVKRVDPLCGCLECGDATEQWQCELDIAQGRCTWASGSCNNQVALAAVEAEVPMETSMKNKNQC